jgi:hypothetical protein
MMAKHRMFKIRLANPMALMIVSVFSTVSMLLYPARDIKNALIITVNLNDSIEITYGNASLAANHACPSMDIGLLL